jgi:tetratricopeptide (TPR) repeat protein
VNERLARGLESLATPRVVLTESSEKNLASLRRAMTRASGFTLLLVIADGPARAEVRERLRAWSGKEGVPELRFFSDGQAGAREVEAFLEGPAGEPIQGAAILDGDTLVERETPVLALNVARDRLGARIAGPLVVILAPRREVELAQLAADLFDVRSATYVVEGRDQPSVELSAHDELGGWLGDISLPESAQNPATLRALEASPEPPPTTALADAWLGYAVDLLRNDRWDEAMTAAGEVIRLAGSAGYEQATSIALQIQASVLVHAERLAEAEQLLVRALDLKQAGIWRSNALLLLLGVLIRQGRLDEATWFFKEKVASIYQKGNLAIAGARAMGLLANLLEFHGQWDEALRIRKAEELPVYETLGDAENRAITMGKIGAILGERGEIEEAIRTLREEALPALEKSGDRTAPVIARFDLARFLWKRAAPGDREQAAELLRLAFAAAEASAHPLSPALRSFMEQNGISGIPGNGTGKSQADAATPANEPAVPQANAKKEAK